ncbi:MAG: alpha-amylase, partial [Mucilaginibacter sp.]|nr:alpha-amylase [Mucilaginibacter sp.]
GWDGDKKNKFTADGRNEKENDAFNYVKKLANYRKNSTTLQTGKMMQYLPQNGIYVYFRYDDKKTVMVAYNSADKEQTTATDRYYERIKGAKNAKNIVTGENQDLSKLTIGAKSTLVLELLNRK